MIEQLVIAALIVEAAAAVVIVILDWREVRFLNTLRPHLHEHLPLFDVLNSRARWVTAIGAYLIGLTLAGAVVGPLSEHFPLLRPINGLLFLLLLAGPIFLGRAMREMPEEALVDETEGDQ